MLFEEDTKEDEKECDKAQGWRNQVCIKGRDGVTQEGGVTAEQAQ